MFNSFLNFDMSGWSEDKGEVCVRCEGVGEGVCGVKGVKGVKGLKTRVKCA